MNVGTGTFLESLRLLHASQLDKEPLIFQHGMNNFYFAIGETITCSTRHSEGVCKGLVPNSNIPEGEMVNSNRHGGKNCNRISI